MSESVSGNYKDLFDIEVQFEEVVCTLKLAEINVDGLFINADTGFDSQKLRDKCEGMVITANICHNQRNGDKDSDHYFDQKLYSIERTNAWIDSFLAFIFFGLKTFHKLKKSR